MQVVIFGDVESVCGGVAGGEQVKQLRPGIFEKVTFS